MWLGLSTDQGRTWSSWHLIDRNELSYFPYLIARGPGELAATWFSGTNETLRTHVEEIKVSDAGEPPQVIEAEPFQPEVWSWVFPDRPAAPIHRGTGANTYPLRFSAKEDWVWSPPFRISKTSGLDSCGGNFAELLAKQ